MADGSRSKPDTSALTSLEEAIYGAVFASALRHALDKNAEPPNAACHARNVALGAVAAHRLAEEIDS